MFYIYIYIKIFRKYYEYYISSHFLINHLLFCVSLAVCAYCICYNVYISQQHFSSRCVLVYVCVYLCVCCNLSSRSCFPGLRWGKAALAAGRFISDTGAQNKEKMIDWMMNYLEVESWGTSRATPARKRGRAGSEREEKEWVQPPFITRSSCRRWDLKQQKKGTWP